MEVFQPTQQSTETNSLAPQQKDLILKMAGDVQVTVSDSLNSMTSYVLIEQRDWFEAELKFLRTWVRPGDRILDIGANHGVYTLSLAPIVGPQGHITAIEPTPGTMARLKNSLELNQFNQVDAYEIGFSNINGTACFQTNDNSELNSVVNDPTGLTNTIEITLQTLDDFSEKQNLGTIDFVKLDAEGQESNVIEGGHNFFQSQSPLVMFELRHDGQVNLELIDQFKKINYEVYQLVPGLNLLRKLNLAEQLDPFQLNLFACKNDRAATLQQQGVLASDSENETNELRPNDNYYLGYLEQFPFAEFLRGSWANCKAIPASGTYYQGLSDYALSHQSVSLSAADRCMLLQRSYLRIEEANNSEQTVSRMSSLARVSWELGHQKTAWDILKQLMQTITSGAFDVGEPFLCVSPTFDRIDPGEKLANWFVASVFTQFAKLSSHSSYFLGKDHLQLLETISQTGFVTAEMARRMKLIKQRFGI